jgi:hypothetical protein
MKNAPHREPKRFAVQSGAIERCVEGAPVAERSGR